MRRMWVISVLCLVLLFTPIYLWKVLGWWQGEGTLPEDVVKVNATIVTDLAGLAQSDPVKLLEQSLARYDENIKNYACTLVKQERIKGKLHPQETIKAWFQGEPYSVMMHWKEGADIADVSLYVKGENDGKMCVRLKRFKITAKTTTDSNDAKATSRYLITEFGLRCGTDRTYKAWKALEEKGIKLKYEYLGVKKIDETGGRMCHVVKRYCDPPEDDGMTEITVYIDAETALQVGTVLKDKEGVIGSYFFKDIEINPKFDENQFKLETMRALK